MRIVVTGATGNVGTSSLAALGADPAVTSILGIARRRPDHSPAKVEWAAADVAEDDLDGHFAGADVVVHPAWLIQPSHDPGLVWKTNVAGSRRVFEAAGRAGVGSIVYLSSVGAYSRGPKDDLVDESWPTDGIATSSYSREKAYVERALDAFEVANPNVRVVRLRPALIFKREAASEIRRLFMGPFVPGNLFRPGLIPVIPRIPGLRFQAVHSADVGEAVRLAVTSQVRGAFNIAAEPVLDPDRLGRLLHARPVPVPASATRFAAALAWRLRLQPAEPGWVDLALHSPLLDATRARTELGWTPRHTAEEALLELFAGLREAEGGDTPPLAADAGGPLRVKEVTTGVGGRAGVP